MKKHHISQEGRFSSPSEPASCWGNVSVSTIMGTHIPVGLAKYELSLSDFIK